MGITPGPQEVELRFPRHLGLDKAKKLGGNALGLAGLTLNSAYGVVVRVTETAVDVINRVNENEHSDRTDI
jgi:hypothetical protein